MKSLNTREYMMKIGKLLRFLLLFTHGGCQVDRYIPSLCVLHIQLYLYVLDEVDLVTLSLTSSSSEVNFYFLSTSYSSVIISALLYTC